MKRIYLDTGLSTSQQLLLNKQQHHYLAKVLRFKNGDVFSVFNANDGEWQVEYHKDICVCIKQLKLPQKSTELWLAFAPIKHDALYFLIEKAVELGVTDLQPILTDHTNAQRINSERMEKNVIEAAQQCERLDIPKIHQPLSLNKFLAKLPAGINWYVAMERFDKNSEFKKPCGFIIGPEGGWSISERNLLIDNTIPISLGDNILRAETAAIACLSLALR